MSICSCRTRTGFCAHNPASYGPASRRGSVRRRAKAIKRREWVAVAARRREEQAVAA